MLLKIAIISFSMIAAFAGAFASEKQEINILFVGKTQTGKSSLINIFYNHIAGKKYEEERAIVIPLLDGVDQLQVNVEAYKSYAVKLRGLNQSQTTKVLRYTAENAKYIVHLWDAPGFNDTNDQISDEEVVNSIAEAIGTTSFNVVAVVLNPNEPSTPNTKANMSRIRTMLPKSAEKNIVGIYAKAANLSKGLKMAGVQSFAHLMGIPPGAPRPKVYHVDGSSFFEEADPEDEASLVQGQKRWLSDSLVVEEIIAEAAVVQPFDASDVILIQKTIEDIEDKFEAREAVLLELDKIQQRIAELKNDLVLLSQKRDGNSNYVKQKTLIVEDTVWTYRRHWYTLWLYGCLNRERVYHESLNSFVDIEMRDRFLQAANEIEVKDSLLFQANMEAESLTRNENELFSQLIDLESKRRRLAMSFEVDPFLRYISLQIQLASRSTDEHKRRELIKMFEKRKRRYDVLKAVADLMIATLSDAPLLNGDI